MSTVSPLVAKNTPTPLTPMQRSGAFQGTPPANDSFGSLLTQSLASQLPAQTAQAAASINPAAATAAMTSLGQSLSAGNLAAAQQAYQSGLKGAQLDGSDDGGLAAVQGLATSQAILGVPASAGSTGASASSEPTLLSMIMGIV